MWASSVSGRWCTRRGFHLRSQIPACRYGMSKLEVVKHVTPRFSCLLPMFSLYGQGREKTNCRTRNLHYSYCVWEITELIAHAVTQNRLVMGFYDNTCLRVVLSFAFSTPVGQHLGCDMLRQKLYSKVHQPALKLQCISAMATYLWY